MNTYKLKKVAESHMEGYNNPNCKDSTKGYRKDGKAPREFLSAQYLATQISSERDLKPVTRNIFQYYDRAGNPTWGPAETAENVKNILAKELKGQPYTKEVVEYNIINPDGSVSTTNKFTMVVFEGEDVATMFRRAGHPLATEVATPAVNAMAAPAPSEELTHA